MLEPAGTRWRISFTSREGSARVMASLSLVGALTFMLLKAPTLGNHRGGGGARARVRWVIWMRALALAFWLVGGGRALVIAPPVRPKATVVTVRPPSITLPVGAE